MKKIIVFIIGLFSSIPVCIGKWQDLTDLIPRKSGGEYLNNLPDGDIASHFIPRLIDILIKVSYTISVAFMIYAGVLYIIAQGEQEDKDKAIDIFIFAITGFLVISASYAVVQGIIRLDFFK